MTKRLLDRQASLLDYLSSGAAMFGAQADAPADPALRGFDPGALRLQARYICNKRLEKIVAVFPQTLQTVGAARRSILREFVEASRSTEKTTLANAQEFHEFLLRRWQRSRPRPAYLPDVAACELAMAEARDAGEDRSRLAEIAKCAGVRPGIRRRPGVIALRCAYDVRAIFEDSSRNVVPPRRAMSLVVAVPAGCGAVRIVETTPNLVEMLILLDDWIDLHRLDAFGEREELLAELAANDFIEIRS